jgi:hypothetical protein
MTDDRDPAEDLAREAAPPVEPVAPDGAQALEAIEPSHPDIRASEEDVPPAPVGEVGLGEPEAGGDEPPAEEQAVAEPAPTVRRRVASRPAPRTATPAAGHGRPAPTESESATPERRAEGDPANQAAAEAADAAPADRPEPAESGGKAAKGRQSGKKGKKAKKARAKKRGSHKKGKKSKKGKKGAK